MADFFTVERARSQVARYEHALAQLTGSTPPATRRSLERNLVWWRAKLVELRAVVSREA